MEVVSESHLMSIAINESCFTLVGFPFCQFEMQELLPQSFEAIKAYLDGYVQEAA